MIMNGLGNSFEGRWFDSVQGVVIKSQVANVPRTLELVGDPNSLVIRP